MSGFDRDNFGARILSMYAEAKENNYILKLDGTQVDELKDIYIGAYIPEDKLRYYTDEQLIKKMMTAIVSVYKQDRGNSGGSGEVIQLVNTVRYDGKNLYLEYAKISPVKMRRFEIGKSRKEIADMIGYGVSAIKNCEAAGCDLSRQPKVLVEKLAQALDCEPETLY